MGREHWVEDKIDNIVYSVPTGVPEYQGKKKYYSTGSIQNGIYSEEGVFSFNERPSRANRIAKINDVFQARMKNTNKPIIIDNANEGALFSTGFIQLRPYSKTYIEKLLYYYVQSSEFIKQRDDLATGSTQEALTDANAVNITFPLPPLNEQKRIVEKLDAILPKVKSAKTRLEKIPAILKNFRQSVLAAACSGRLTEDWREGKDLPEWVEKKIRDIAIINPKNKLNDDLETSFIPMALISSIFNVTPNFEIRKWKEIKKGFNHFQNNDIIIAKITPCFENSKAGIVTNLCNGFGAGTTEIFVLRCLELVLPKYLYYIIKTNKFIENGKSVMTGSAGQQRVPKDYIENYSIYLPPLEEQHEIVRRVEKLFALADSLEAKYKKAFARVEKLEQAILAKAFRGELVEPDPNDEPAEVLLKRILEEKAKLDDEKKTKMSKDKNKRKSN